MTGNTILKDVILAIVLFLYPFLLLVVSRGLSSAGIRKDGQRKFVHAGMGLVILIIPWFTHLWIALIPPVLFTLINLIDYRFGWFSQIQGEDAGNVGTVLYPISYIVLMLIFFHTRWWGLAVLGMFAMAFGDAGASIIGRAFGRTTYTVEGEVRSVEGSVAMFAVTFVITFIVLLAYSSQLGISPRLMTLFAASIIIGGAATIIEALSIKGSDNITVPVLTALVSWGLIAVMMPNVLGTQSIVNQPLY
jgi:phytol kinase